MLALACYRPQYPRRTAATTQVRCGIACRLDCFSKYIFSVLIVRGLGTATTEDTVGILCIVRCL